MANKRLKAIIEGVISEYGGEPVKQAVLFYLENVYKIKPEEALDKPELFVSALKEIYGPFEGIIENEICDKIAKEYGIKFKGQGLVKLAEELKNAD